MPRSCVRIQATDLAGGHAAHLDGRNRPKSAINRPGMVPTAMLDAEGNEIDREKATARWNDAVRANAAARRERRRAATPGRPPKPARELVIPLWCRPEKRRQMERAAMHWIAGAFPHSPLALAARHTDEASEHLHVVIVPFGADGKHGWERACESSPIAGPDGARGRIFLQRMAQDFHAKVGHRFGLGQPDGRSRGNAPLDRSRSATARVERAEQDAAAALERAAEEHSRADCLEADLRHVVGIALSAAERDQRTKAAMKRAGYSEGGYPKRVPPWRLPASRVLRMVGEPVPGTTAVPAPSAPPPSPEPRPRVPQLPAQSAERAPGPPIRSHER